MKHKPLEYAFFISGLIVCGTSVIAGLWFGLYVCLYGGIMDVINGFSSDPWNAGVISFGVIKVFFANIVGWATFILGMMFGSFLIQMSDC